MGRKTIKTKDILKKSFLSVYEVSLYLLVFELIYKGLILVLFKPILNIIVSLFIRAGGYEILVNGEIAKFLLSFTGILMILLVLTLSVVLIYYEFSVILLILDSSKKKEKIKLLEITETALLKLKSVIKNRQIGLALYILVLIPILNIGIQSSLMPALSIPDFITGEVAKYPGSEILFLLLILLMVYLFAKLFIVLPAMLFSNYSFKEAAKISFKTIKGDGFKIAALIMVGMLLWITLTYLPFILLENAQFILLRILRDLANISMLIFTLLISPFILSISLESYNAYVASGFLKRQDLSEKIKLGYFGKSLWKIVEKTFGLIQFLIAKARNNLKIVIVLAFVLMIGLTVFSEESVRPLYDKQLLIGHRGGEYGVENTTEAIMFAGVNGADYAEMDVLLTKDNVPVVIHDNNLQRLGNIDKNISDMTMADVAQITIKSGDKEATIPSLEELSQEIKGNTKLLLEFKTHGKEEASIVDKTIEVLEKEGILDETIFHTSETKIIEEFNEKYEELSMGYVFIGKIGTFSARKMSKMPVDFISAEESLINKNMIREAHRANKAIFAWTINEDYKAERLFALGVDGIITDYPIEMIELRDHYKDYHERQNTLNNE